MISVLPKAPMDRHQGLHDVREVSWGAGNMFWDVSDGRGCRDSMLPDANLGQINEMSISLDRGICWELVGTEDPHQQSTKLKTTQYSIRDRRNNNYFGKTCIPDDSGPYQSYTKIWNLRFPYARIRSGCLTRSTSAKWKILNRTEETGILSKQQKFAKSDQ